MEARREADRAGAAGGLVADILDTIEEGFYALDEQWRIVYANRRACEMWGVRRDAVIGENLWEHFPELAGTLSGDRLREAVAAARVVEYESFSPVLRIWLHVRVCPIRGPLSGVYLRDIDQQKRAHEALRDSEERLRIASHTARLGYWEHDLAGRVLRASDLCKANYGLPPEAELSYEAVFAAIHPQYRERVRELSQRAAGDRIPYEAEYPITWPDGSTHWISVRGQCIYAGDGTPLRKAGVTMDITRQKAAEHALREGEERFRRLFEQSPLGKAMAGPDFRFREVNPALCRMLGYTAEELAGMSFLDIVHPDDQANCRRQAAAAATGEVEQIQLEERFLRKSGEPLWVSVNVAPVRDPEGRVLYTLGIVENIDERRRMTEALRDSEQRLKLAQAAGEIGTWDWDLETGQIRWSGEQFHLLGLDPERDGADPYEAWLRVLHPEDRDAADARARGHRDSTQPFTSEFRILRADGVRCILSRGTTIRDERGTPVRMLGVNIDITERKRLEQELTESEERYRLFAESSLEGVLVHDFQTILDVSSRFAEMFGYTPEEMIGTPGTEFMRLVDPDDFAASIRRARSGEQAVSELRCFRRDGTPFSVEYAGKDISYRGRRVRIAIMRDITERKRAERALSALNESLEQQVEERARQLYASRARLRAYFENAPDWLSLQRATADGRFVFEDVNPAYERAYGVARDQLIGRSVEDVLGPEAARVPLHYFRECVRTGAPQRYVAQRSLAGRTRTIDVLVVLVPGEMEGGDRFFITTARDLTEREELEAQLRQAQKMEAVGQLTGGVAHDFNNLLTAVVSSLELIRTKTGEERTRNLADTAIRAAMRGGQLTHQLLSFARRQTLRPSVVDLNALLRETEALLRGAAGETIEFSIDAAPGLWACEVDQGQFQAAAMNLVVNARDAMPRGGRLILATANAEIGTAEGGLDMPLGDYVVLSVRDTGQGMTPEVLARAFEPFFTTKNIGKGSGLGLSMVHGFARQSGGALRIRSRPGAGTTVQLYLPRCAAAVSGSPPAPDRGLGSVPRASGTILVVEDNPEVLRTTVDVLRALGYRVFVAGTGPQALEVIRRGEAVDLLLSDVVMPGGMSGVDLAQHARRMRPSLKVLLTSGYTAEAFVGPGRDTELPFLAKPYRPAELGERIIALLNPVPA